MRRGGDSGEMVDEMASEAVGFNGDGGRDIAANEAGCADFRARRLTFFTAIEMALTQLGQNHVVGTYSAKRPVARRTQTTSE